VSSGGRRGSSATPFCHVLADRKSDNNKLVAIGGPFPGPKIKKNRLGSLPQRQSQAAYFKPHAVTSSPKHVRRCRRFVCYCVGTAAASKHRSRRHRHLDGSAQPPPSSTPRTRRLRANGGRTDCVRRSRGRADHESAGRRPAGRVISRWRHGKASN